MQKIHVCGGNRKETPNNYISIYRLNQRHLIFVIVININFLFTIYYNNLHNNKTMIAYIINNFRFSHAHLLVAPHCSMKFFVSSYFDKQMSVRSQNLKLIAYI